MQVRQQVGQLMSGAMKAREAAATGIREANTAREAAEQRATHVLEQASNLHHQITENQVPARPPTHSLHMSQHSPFQPLCLRTPEYSAVIQHRGRA